MIRRNEHEVNEWVELYTEALLDRAYYLLSNEEDAYDVVQETFIAAFTSYEKYQKQCNVLTWLHRILQNKVSDFYRKKYNKMPTINFSDIFDSRTGNWLEDSAMKHWASPGTDKEREKLLETLESCVEKLPLQWKIPVKLYYLEGCKTDGICKEAGLSSSNLWKILQRSRLQLRKCIQINWYDHI